MLEVKGIHVFYGSVQALWNVSFHVGEGEIVTLVGANGAGKTTATRAAQGLCRPSSGEVRFQGRPVGRMGPHRVVREGLCLVPEARLLFPHMSVLENLELGAFHRQARERRMETLRWVYQLFPMLEERTQQKAHTLSGGEQQMVAIARGLMARPRLLMFDEPSLGLAPLLVAEVFRVIAEINKQGISILLVEQNARRALALADRAYVMEAGRVVREGGGRELLGDTRIRQAYLGV